MPETNNSERIAQLLARKMAGVITTDEQQELQGLLQQHSYASYVDEVLQHEWKDKYDYYTPGKSDALYQKHLDRLSQATQEEEKVEVVPLIEFEKKSPVRRILGWVAAASVIAVCIAAWQRWPAGKANAEAPIAYQKQIVTPKGNRSELILPDGSKVWVNAGSTLDYPQQFTGKTRNVRLQGEAYFEVKENKERPFFVHTNTFSVKVLGTGFNIRAYANEDSAVAALVHGSIEVVLKGDKEQSIRLRPNEKVIVPTLAVTLPSQINKNITAPITAIPEKMDLMEDNLQQETAWVNSKLAFKNTTLANIAVMLENWFGTTIRFKDESKKNIRLSGVFDGESLQETLYVLREVYGKFNYKTDSEGVIWIE